MSEQVSHPYDPKVPSLSEANQLAVDHQAATNELLDARKHYNQSITRLDVLFERLIGKTVPLSGTVVQVLFWVGENRVPLEDGPLVEPYMGPLRPDRYTITDSSIETSHIGGLIRPEHMGVESPELVVAYHGLTIYATTRDMERAQRAFDQEHPA